MIDFNSIKSTAMMYAQTLVSQWAPGGTINGPEYVTTNPTRDDKNPGSFCFNLKSGKWSDFSSKDGGKDIISYYAYTHGLKHTDRKDYYMAAKQLSNQLNLSPKQPPQQQPSNDRETKFTKVIWPVPLDAPPLPKVRNRKINGTWFNFPVVQQWAYLDKTQNVVMYVARIETPRGKETLPLALWQDPDTGAYKWRFKAEGIPKIPFNFHIISEHPTWPIICVEGEKCADILQSILESAGEDIIATTWCGGANRANKTNWKTIRGRKILLWPDFDWKSYQKNHPESGKIMPYPEQPGYVAMRVLGEILSCQQNEIKIITPDQSKPDGWDVADAILIDRWDIDKIFSFISDNTVELNPVAPKKPELPSFFDEPNPPTTRNETDVPVLPDQNEPTEFTHPHFRLLGYDYGVFYYLPFNGQQIVALTASGHTAAALCSIAPLSHWEMQYPMAGSTGANWTAIASDLMQQSMHFGVYNPSVTRGRGAWIDKDRVVLNTGTSLIVDGKEFGLSQIKSRYVYAAAATMDFCADGCLTNIEANIIRQIFDMLSWDRPLSGLLCAGWCVVAVICGALNWRPHIWITGAAGSGKSWVLSNLIRKLLGNSAIYVQSETTAAGIRQRLKCDAIPVVFDEFEAESETAQKRVQADIELARQASTEDGGQIIKGGQTGTSSSFSVRSCFCFSSISVSLSHRSDESRIAVLSLLKSNDRERFIKIKTMAADNLADDFCKKFRGRAIKYARVIRDNAMVFAEAVTIHLGDSRAGDQLGALLAGAYSLSSCKAVGRDEALDWVKKQDWSERKPDSEYTDEKICLSHIFSHTVRYNHVEIPVSEAVSELMINENVNRNHAALGSVGVAYRDERICIARKSPSVSRILRGTPWGNSYSDILLRLPGATLGRRSFCGVQQHCVEIPNTFILPAESPGWDV